MSVFGPCVACLAKENHISDLKAQIEMLQKLVFPPKAAQDLSVTDLEVDALMNGNDEPIKVDDSVDREAQLLLSGDYDTAEV